MTVASFQIHLLHHGQNVREQIFGIAAGGRGSMARTVGGISMEKAKYTKLSAYPRSCFGLELGRVCNPFRCHFTMSRQRVASNVE